MARRSGRPRGAPRLLFDPKFGAVVWGKFFSSTAYWMHTTVASIFVYQVTSSALMVGLVVTALQAPQLVLGPLSGAWADRGHALTQIVAGRLLIAAGSGSLAVWFTWFHEDHPGYGVGAALLASLLCGVGFALGGPPLQAIVPALVTPAELPVAMSLNTAPLTASAVAGPSIGAYIAVQVGPATTFAVAAAIHLLFVVALVASRLPWQRRAAAHTDMSMRGALRYCRIDRGLVALLLGIAGIGFGAETSVTLAPAVVAGLQESDRMVGMVTGSFGAGAVTGLVIFGALNRLFTTVTLASIGVALMAVGLLAVAGAPSLPVAFGGFAVCGFGFTLAMTTMSALVQERSPSHLRGRIMALWLMAMLGARPLAAALEGLLADLTTFRIAVLASIGVLAVVLLLIRPRRLNRPLHPSAAQSQATEEEAVAAGPSKCS